jgi:hypothetical protein
MLVAAGESGRRKSELYGRERNESDRDEINSYRRYGCGSG